jgi:hypothetical protein
MLTVALTPESGHGVARFDSRYPTTVLPVEKMSPPHTPPPDRHLPPGVVPAAVTTIGPPPPGSRPPPGASGIPANLEPPPVTPLIPELVVRLRVIRGMRVNVDYPVYAGRNVLGRFADRPVDIDLTGVEPDGQVWSSRRHAALTLDRGLLVVEDLNSLNGTWVNGTRLRAGAALPIKAGDVIQIGVAQLRVEIDPVSPASGA